jgi:hypothetical protein
VDTVTLGVSQSPRRGPGSKRIGDGTSRTNGGTLIGEPLGPSLAPSRGCGGSSARDRAAWILVDAPRAISPHMRQSFVDRQYSPSTGMDWSE